MPVTDASPSADGMGPRLAPNSTIDVEEDGEGAWMEIAAGPVRPKVFDDVSRPGSPDLYEGYPGGFHDLAETPGGGGEGEQSEGEEGGPGTALECTG